MEPEKKEANILVILAVIIVVLIVLIVGGLYFLNQKSTGDNLFNFSGGSTSSTLSIESSTTSYEPIDEGALNSVQGEVDSIINKLDTTLKEVDSIDTTRDNEPTL